MTRRAALFVPQHYEPNYAYPLIVWMHGPGSDERELLEVMPHVSRRNYVGVAPRGMSLSHGEFGDAALAWPQSSPDIHEAEQRVFDSIEIARRKLHIAPGRIFLAGFDGGGTMAFRIALNHPRQFAGVLSIGGAFPSGQTPLGQWPYARNLAVFLALGRDSIEYSPDSACRDLRLLHAAGISVTLRQYPHGHYLTTHILSDVDRWIMEQISSSTGATIASENRPAHSMDQRPAPSTKSQPRAYVVVAHIR